MLKTITRLPLHWQILAALVLAVIVGMAATPEAKILGVSLLSILNFFGTLFLNALKMLIVPLIASSIALGCISSVAHDNFDRAYYKNVNI